MPRHLSSDAPCDCGHAHVAHEHYRRGTDCALCTCDRFRLASFVTRRAARLLRRPRSAAA